MRVIDLDMVQQFSGWLDISGVCRASSAQDGLDFLSEGKVSIYKKKHWSRTPCLVCAKIGGKPSVYPLKALDVDQLQRTWIPMGFTDEPGSQWDLTDQLRHGVLVTTCSFSE